MKVQAGPTPLAKVRFVPLRCPACSCYFHGVRAEESSRVKTLAWRMGDVPHVSGLQIRLSRISGAGNRLGDWLFKVAVERGASHYRRPFDSSLPPDNPAVSDEEVGIGLCLGGQDFHLDRLRAAAQLLSSARVDIDRLCSLAIQERCEPILLHVAEIARKYAPEQPPWSAVRQKLRPRPVPRTDALPHWTRLVSYTGTTRNGVAKTDWLKRDE